MKFERRSDPEVWLEEGKCPFYFHEMVPKCIFVRMALGGRDVFEDQDEAEKFVEQDCGGNLPQSCPFVSALWDFEEFPLEERTFKMPEGGLLEFTDADPNRDDALDTLILPICTSVNGRRLWPRPEAWGRDVYRVLSIELSMLEPPLKYGEAVVTGGCNTGYDHLIHVAVFDDVGGRGLDPDAVTVSVMNALNEAALEAKSFELRPFCIQADGIIYPDIPDLFNSTMRGVTRFFTGPGEGMHVRVCAPPGHLGDYLGFWHALVDGEAGG